MMHTIKTIHVCIHDAPQFGDTPVFKTEIHCQAYISHKQLVEFRHRLEVHIKAELEHLTRKPDYSGAWPNG